MHTSSIKTVIKVLALLIISALLEVGGDAGIRTGLLGKKEGFLLGALMLITYGVVVNLSRLDFSKLMGIYIAVFFVVAQAISVVVFKEKISLPVYIGGAFIIIGGCVMAFWKKAA